MTYTLKIIEGIEVDIPEKMFWNNPLLNRVRRQYKKEQKTPSQETIDKIVSSIDYDPRYVTIPSHYDDRSTYIVYPNTYKSVLLNILNTLIETNQVHPLDLRVECIEHLSRSDPDIIYEVEIEGENISVSKFNKIKTLSNEDTSSYALSIIESEKEKLLKQRSNNFKYEEDSLKNEIKKLEKSLEGLYEKKQALGKI